MKTREEIKNHLSETGYTMKAMNRIVGFLIGIGMPNDINIKHGEHKWEDFLTWWNKEDIKKDVLSDLIEYLAERCFVAGPTEVKRLVSFIDFIVDEFGDEVQDENAEK